jgi:hypothetical protein
MTRLVLVGDVGAGPTDRSRKVWTCLSTWPECVGYRSITLSTRRRTRRRAASLARDGNLGLDVGEARPDVPQAPVLTGNHDPDVIEACGDIPQAPVLTGDHGPDVIEACGDVPRAPVLTVRHGPDVPDVRVNMTRVRILTLRHRAHAVEDRAYVPRARRLIGGLGALRGERRCGLAARERVDG